MFYIYDLKQKESWLKVLKKFEDKVDIYFYPKYVESFEKNGDGKAILIHYSKDDFEVINVVMKRDISSHPNFKGKIEPDTYFDYTTPYGYGGFVFKEVYPEIRIKEFIDTYKDFCLNSNIISEFIRFHPVLKKCYTSKKPYTMYLSRSDYRN